MEFVKVVEAVRRMCASCETCSECPMDECKAGCSAAMIAEYGRPEEVERIAVEWLERMKGARE